jgi:hypothetical protein
MAISKVFATSSAVQVESAQAESPREPENGGTEKPSSENKAASGSSVRLSVRPNDPTILTALIDRTATRSRIVEDLQGELAKFGVPYRDVDQRIFEAVRLLKREGLSYSEASVRVFGYPDKAELIRYWQNNWGRR